MNTYDYPPERWHYPACEDGKWYWCAIGTHHFTASTNFCATDNYPARRASECVCDLIGETA